MRARRCVTKWGGFDDLDEASTCEVFLRDFDLDLNDLTRKRTVNEHHPAIGIAGHGLAASDETFRGELHALQRTGASCLHVGQACDTGAMNNDSEWYWDINRKIAVPASERGSFEHFIGPYASQREAENWEAKVEERNEDWDSDDEKWEHAAESDDR
jgi:hypothetical protein